MAQRIKPETIGRVQDAINRLRFNRNESLTSVARQEHTTARTIKRINEELGLFETKQHQPGKRYEFEFPDNGTVIIVDINGDVHEIEVTRKTASTIGKYWAAFEYGNYERLKQIAVNNTIRDVYGNKYRLTGNVNYLLRQKDLYDELSDPFLSYRGS